MSRSLRTTTLAVLAALSVPAPEALATAADDIRARLEQWREDFNAGRSDAVCDLFSKGAIAQYRGQPERNHDEICELLQRSLSDPTRDFRYNLDVHEIIVEGSLAVVRLTWTLSVSPGDVLSVEPGLDVFRKEADGEWRIIRYLAYEMPQHRGQ